MQAFLGCVCMGLRPAHCYKEINKPAFTRVAITVPRRNYIGASPANKIRQFNMGNPTKDFSHVIDLKIMQTVQLRDNAIEAMRTTLTRALQKALGKEGYFLKIRAYPHHILRENKQATGAGADRIQKGMSHPYGRPIGRAARLHEGQTIVSVLVDGEQVNLAKQSMLKAGPKLGTKIRLDVGTDTASIGTKPKMVREMLEEAKKEETATAEGTEPKTAEAKKEETKKEAGGKTDAKTKPEGKGKTEAKGKK